MPAPQSWAARCATTVHTSLTMMLSSQVLSSPKWCKMARTCSRARQSLGWRRDSKESVTCQEEPMAHHSRDLAIWELCVKSPARWLLFLNLLSSGTSAHPTGPQSLPECTSHTKKQLPIPLCPDEAGHCYDKTDTQKKKEIYCLSIAFIWK